MDFEFHFWRQNMQDSVTDFIPEMRGREIVGSPPQEFKGEKGNVTKLNAALEPRSTSVSLRTGLETL